MSKPKNPEWYDVLNPAEAREVTALDLILDGCKSAVTAASQRRDHIARRASMRLKWRLDHWGHKGEKSDERKQT